MGAQRGLVVTAKHKKKLIRLLEQLLGLAEEKIEKREKGHKGKKEKNKAKSDDKAE